MSAEQSIKSTGEESSVCVTALVDGWGSAVASASVDVEALAVLLARPEPDATLTGHMLQVCTSTLLKSTGTGGGVGIEVAVGGEGAEEAAGGGLADASAGGASVAELKTEITY